MFNDRFIDEKIEKMAARKQLRVIRALNKLANSYRGLIKKRELPSIIRQPRIRGHVHIRDIIIMIQQLLNCRRKTTTHFALDLYIVLLSGQRFLADH